MFHFPVCFSGESNINIFIIRVGVAVLSYQVTKLPGYSNLLTIHTIHCYSGYCDQLVIHTILMVKFQNLNMPCWVYSSSQKSLSIQIWWAAQARKVYLLTICVEPNPRTAFQNFQIYFCCRLLACPWPSRPRLTWASNSTVEMAVGGASESAPIWGRSSKQASITHR